MTTRNIKLRMVLLIVAIMMLITSLLLPYADTASANELPVAQGEWNDLTEDREGKNMFNTLDGVSQIIEPIGSQNFYTIIRQNRFEYLNDLSLKYTGKGFVMTVKQNTTYTLSYSVTQTNFINATKGGANIIFIYDISNGFASWENYIAENRLYGIQTENFSVSKTFNTGSATKIGITFSQFSKIIDPNLWSLAKTIITNAMLNEGTTVLPYEPYLSNIPDFQYSYNGATQSQSLYYYNYITLKKWIDTYVPHFYGGLSTIKVYKDSTKTNLLYTCKNDTRNIDYKFTEKVYIDVIYERADNNINSLLDALKSFAIPFINGISTAFKFLFLDFPPIFGLSLGWWLVGIMVFMAIVNKILGGKE